MALLEQAAREAQLGELPPGCAPLYAMFLLADFGASEALPAIVAAASLPGELPFDLFGDVVTEDLPRIFMRLAGGRMEFYDELIGDRRANPYARSAAVACHLPLCRDGVLTRPEAISRLRRHLRQAIDAQDGEITDSIIFELDGLAAQEAREDIVEAFRQGLVDPDMMRLDDVAPNLVKGEAWFRLNMERSPFARFGDAVDELASWLEPEERSPPAFAAAEPALAALPSEAREPPRRFGRNDPCPCGSGRKYKKCCLGNEGDGLLRG